MVPAAARIGQDRDRSSARWVYAAVSVSSGTALVGAAGPMIDGLFMG